MRKNLFSLVSILVLLSMMLASCAPTEVIKTVEVQVEKEVIITVEVPVEVEKEVIKTVEVQVAPTDRVVIRWFVGLGSGTDAQQQTIQRGVVDKFNASQDKIWLELEVVPYNSARDALSTEIASGNAPDFVGPVGWGGSNDFYGQWLDLAPYIKESNYDTSVFNQALVKFYQTEEGQVGLPFAVYPAAVFYRPELFDEAGLAYPPTKYGDKYKMPDGSEVDWSWETLGQVGKLLTIDVNGKNSTEDGFDAAQVAQFGYVPQYQNGRHMSGFFGGQELWKDGKAQIPEGAKAAWQTYFDAIWGLQPWSPNAAWESAPENGSGNPFQGGKVAMGITHAWYTCCVGELVKAGGTFDFGILPSYNGTVYGRVDADTYRIFKSSKHPKEAFEAMSYLIGPASLELLTTYGGMPARVADQAAWLKDKQAAFPFVKNWDTLIAGLGYPDVPSAEGYYPNGIEANNRIGQFFDLMRTDKTIDLDAEIAKLMADLQVIFDKK